MESKKFKTVDEYLSTLPTQVRPVLEKLRNAIKETLPQAEEVISYNMPAFKSAGSVLVYYAANKAHVGFYPTASPMIIFKEELAPYKTSKGAIQFPYENEIPIALVKEIVKFRVNETLEKKTKTSNKK